MKESYLYICPICDNIVKTHLQPDLAKTINVICPLCFKSEELAIPMKRYIGDFDFLEDDLPEREKFQRKVRSNEWR